MLGFSGAGAVGVVILSRKLLNCGMRVAPRPSGAAQFYLLPTTNPTPSFPSQTPPRHPPLSAPRDHPNTRPPQTTLWAVGL